MGEFHIFSRYLLGLLCAASFAFSPVANAGALSVDVRPTTGHVVTNSATVALPPRTTIGPAAANSPVFGPLPGGGAYQTTFSDITIKAANDGIASSTKMSGRVRATAGAMKSGLSRCLTSFRCNVAVMVGAAGIESLFEGIDWVMGDGGKLQKRVYEVMTPEEASEYENMPGAFTRQANFSMNPAPTVYAIPWSGGYATCALTNGGLNLAGSYYNPNLRHYRCVYAPGVPAFDNTPKYEPLDASDIKLGVDTNYNPHPADLPYLSTGGLDWAHPGIDFEILDIPPITGTENQTFTEFADGTSKAIVPEYEFSWSSPSKQPIVNVKERIIDTTYSPTGEPISTNITTINGAGSSANLPPEPPTDCAFMPTVCRFIDWFTEPDPDQTEPDLSQLVDTVDIEREFTVGSSTASCPAPFVIELSFVPSVSISLEPFCNLADMMRPLLLSLCFLFSGMIILRT